MKISYNAAAMYANNAVNAADNKVAQSLKRLSSGLKITASKDDPSGYAIGRRMNAQIGGITVATKNSNRGVNIVETADGALTEVHDMLQRMNELAVKGAHGVLTTTDRQMLNAELKQLKEEITRIAQDTEFNGQPLLDGSFDLRGYTNNQAAKVGYYSDEVLSKVYTIDSLEIIYNDDGSIDIDATNNAFVPGEGFPDNVQITKAGDGWVTITGERGFEITLDIVGTNEDITFSGGDGLLYGVKLFFDSESASGLEKDKVYVIDDLQVRWEDAESGAGVDVTWTNNWLTNNNPFTEANGFPAGTIASIDENGLITVTSTSDPDFQLFFGTASAFGIQGGGAFTEYFNVMIISQDKPIFKDLQLDITGIGSMDLQTGANEGQQLKIRIPTISLNRLGIENTEVTDEETSTKAITEIKGAILYVSDARSRLGAYQNRLEHTINNLNVSNENMTASYSNIMDADMAEEMTEFTTQQVIAQAATSMLAQANERPSQVLQLLQ